MTDEQILKKAIEKAMDNGYKKNIAMDRKVKIEMLLDDREVSLFDIIFSHPFAKAFCKGMEDGIIAKGNVPESTFEEVGEPHQWFLQQMVLEEEPLKYLEKFL